MFLVGQELIDASNAGTWPTDSATRRSGAAFCLGGGLESSIEDAAVKVDVLVQVRGGFDHASRIARRALATAYSPSF
jgi:hypothetical protein